MLPAPGRTRQEFQALRDRIPLRRTGDMKSLRMAFQFLVENSYVTGQVLYVDGGWHLCA
jgi:NAD(P)-dependent dehydrogenase (short-subunit alcohol dehydrogenase family)